MLRISCMRKSRRDILSLVFHDAMSTLPKSRPLRILFLHGFTQTGTLFYAKTRALHKALQKAFPASQYELHYSYPPGPAKLSVADIPGHTNSAALDGNAKDEEEDCRGWWRRKDHDVKGRGGLEIVYEGLEAGMQSISTCIQEEGPFDGVVGFSQGACAAGMVASLLEGPKRREAFERLEKNGGIEYPQSFLEQGGKGMDGVVQGPLKFAVCYGGFRALGRKYEAFYEPKLKTPVLHVLGQVDVVVEEARSRQLVAACDGGEDRVVMHPGGHFVPSQKPWLNAVVGFIKDSIEGKEGI